MMLRLRLLALLVLLPSVGGCGFVFGTPNRASVKVRKQNQQLEGQIAKLKQEVAARDATIRGLNQRVGTVPTLEPARLDRLFTVHAMKLGRLTGGADLDGSKPGHEGFKVYAVLLDQHGDEIKSAGTFVVEAFDLASGQPTRLGRWEFGLDQAQSNWHSFLMRYEYVLTCPWQGATPRKQDITVRATFTDELTGREFVEQRVAKVDVQGQGGTTPGTQPAAAR